MKRLLFMTAEGIGNVIETIPVIRTLKERLNFEFIDYWHAFGSYNIPKIIPYVDRWIVGKKIRTINPSEYKGKVSTRWTKNRLNISPLDKLPLLSNIQPLRMSRSEVDTYMDIARNLGVKEEDLIWHGKCNYNEVRDPKNKYDIVIHNGYNRYGASNWSIKSYPYYREIVKLLKGFRICSIGIKNEYIKDTDDKTGLDLLTSLGIIKNCKVFLSNDSGLYHAANALEVKNVVIFTATSIDKNYDERFHKYSTLIYRDDLKCRPCQASENWNKNCKNWECRNIDPKIIVNTIRKKIN